MDTVKIGKYLAELRHGQGLTQEALGEKLGVTNKTVSRWENGNYLPPVDALQLLSDLYGVTINELLSGEHLAEEAYKAAAEEHLKEALESSAFEVQDKMAFFKRKWRREHIPALICEMVAITAVLLACGFVWDNGVQYAALIAAFVLPVVRHNQMMAYVEQKVFGKG